MSKSASKGVVEVPNLYAIWLNHLMESDEYKQFIKEFHEKHPNSIFHHSNLSEQLNVMIIEQLNNISKEKVSEQGN